MMPFRSTRLLAALSVALALVALLAYAALWFFFAREQARAAAVVAARAAEEQAERHDASRERLLLETEVKRARVDALFVGQDGAVQFLKELEQTARDAAAELTVIKVASPEESVNPPPPGGFEKLLVAVEVGGSFAEVHRFLTLLDLLPRPLAISRASFSREESGAWSGIFELEALKLR